MLIQCYTVHLFHFPYAVKIDVIIIIYKQMNKWKNNTSIWDYHSCTRKTAQKIGQTWRALASCIAARNSCKIEWIYHWHREASEAAGACWARSTISSVVVPMISFARFNGTHRILPIESWVENYCKDQPTEHLGLEILIWQILLLLKITVVALKVTQKMTFFIHICSVLFWWSLEFAKRTYPRNNTQLF